MRALWLVRKSLTKFPGGDTTQVLQTKASLEKLGVQIELRSVDELPTKVDAKRHDHIHLFHLDRLWENLPAAQCAQKLGIPYALSTIYWPTTRFDESARRGINGILARSMGESAFQSFRQIERWGHARVREKAAIKWSMDAMRFENGARKLLEHAAVCFPNSAVEADRINERFGTDIKMTRVPNAVGDAFANAPLNSDQQRHGILCVGRIEPRKNQLALIRAVSKRFGQPLDLTIVGSHGRFNKKYYEQCRTEAGDHVRFISHQGIDELIKLYQSALVHASVSWYDTPGLVNLEAGMCGCPLVIGTEGSSTEYFEDLAWYADPADPASIREAIEHAMHDEQVHERTRDMQKRIVENYTWHHAAQATLQGYEHALSAASV